MESKSHFLSCENLDRVAYWVGSNVASAFFASLERCSCINLNTADPEDVDDPVDSRDRPLLLTGLAAPLDSDQPQINPQSEHDERAS